MFSCTVLFRNTQISVFSSERFSVAWTWHAISGTASQCKMQDSVRVTISFCGATRHCFRVCEILRPLNDAACQVNALCLLWCLIVPVCFVQSSYNKCCLWDTRMFIDRSLSLLACVLSKICSTETSLLYRVFVSNSWQQFAFCRARKTYR